MKTHACCMAIVLVLLASFHQAAAQGTAFTYQGRLNVGTNLADGNYDLKFSLYDSATSGTQVASPVTNTAVAVSSGLFTTTLDFGATAFSGAERWLKVSVRTNGAGLFTDLAPRQTLMPTPYAIAAQNLTGMLPAGQLGGTYTNPVVFNSGANVFAGNGAGLTGVDATTFGGLGAASFWQMSGNAGTTAGTNFVGTSDNQPLELWVNGERALRLEPNTNSPNIIGGFSGNYVNNAVGVTISGGGSGDAPNAVYGTHNFISSYATLGGGSGNSINYSSAHGTIAGGSGNNIRFARYATIAGGAANQIYGSSLEADYSTIGGGIGNRVRAWGPGTIGGGQYNEVFGPGATVGGGVCNTNWAREGTIAGGTHNFIYGSEGGLPPIAQYASIGGGSGNSVQYGSKGATIAGGSNNRVEPEAVGATIGGGSGNQITKVVPNLSLVQMGQTIGGGQSNLVTSRFATIPGGTQARALSYGQMAYAGGQFAQTGDAQTSLYVLRGNSADASETELFLDGSSARMRVPTNTTWGVEILIAGRTTGGISGFYVIRGMVENNAGTISLVGTLTKDFTREDVASWDTFIDVDSSSQSLVVRAMGSAGNNIRWVASVRTVEVTF